MCGIAGVVAGRAEDVDAVLARMGRALAHRGPDASGAAVWSDSEGRVAGFAHRRLSIIDLSAAGNQPMTTADGRFSVIYNGEIYNYLELRRSLEDQGVRLATQSDTEVLLHLYARHGN